MVQLSLLVWATAEQSGYVVTVNTTVTQVPQSRETLVQKFKPAKCPREAEHNPITSAKIAANSPSQTNSSLELMAKMAEKPFQLSFIVYIFWHG